MGGTERRSGKEPFIIAHRGDIRHLEERTALPGIVAGEERITGIVKHFGGSIILMERSRGYPIPAGTYYAISFVSIPEEIRVAEIRRITIRSTIDNGVIGRLCPGNQSFIYRSRHVDGGAGIVHSRIEDPRLAVGDSLVSKDAPRPAAFDIIGFLGRNSDQLFRPVAEVGRRDMPPMETRHIRPVAVLLEEDMIFAISVCHTMRFVHPVRRRHGMVARTGDIILPMRSGDV